MNWANFASTSAQHAPVPGTMQSSRPLPTQTAWMNAQSISGGTIHTISTMPMIVRMELVMFENRLERNQPTAPISLRGGARVGSSSSRK